MKNLASWLRSIFGTRLIVVLFFLVLSWLTGYQLGLQEKLEKDPSSREICRRNRSTECAERVLGDETGPRDPKSDEKKAERKIAYQETSPDGAHETVFYEMPFLGEGELDYHNYLNNQHFYSVEDISLTSGREAYVFVGDYKSGRPHWLDNEFIFFTGGCGTGCQLVYLVNTRTKEARQAALFTNPLGADTFETNFSDWFGQDFRFPGWSKNIRSVFLEGKSYLVFQMWDRNSPLGEKRFLFTGKSLEPL